MLASGLSPENFFVANSQKLTICSVQGVQGVQAVNAG